MQLLNLLRRQHPFGLRLPHRLFPNQYSIAWTLWGNRLATKGTIIGVMALVGVTGCSTIREAAMQSSPSHPLQATDFNVTVLAESSRVIHRQLQRWLPPKNAIAITLYRLDERCEDYEPETSLVDPNQPLMDAVRQILLNQKIIAFDLSGYRVIGSSNSQRVTIDFRLDPDSQRLLTSLSMCEQKALLGSLRQTLLGQPTWNIQQVEFTNRGEPLFL